MEVTGETADQLRRLETVVDPELAELASRRLIDELLPRVRDLLGVDTVAVLMLDRSGTELVAHAALGLDEIVMERIRLPVGRGFAGRVASTRAPLMIADVGPDNVMNPILWRRGIRAMLGVPMITGGRLVGVLHVGSFRPREFVDEDISVLQVAAERIATTVDDERVRGERAAARTLQTSLLPTRLPEVEGLEFASRFVPAEAFGVGGDWYDAFRLPSGVIGVVVGDVAGAGLRAAVVMGRIRSALRAYALESKGPAEALDRLRRKFSHFEPQQMATVLYITIAPDLRSFTLASTGHLAPIMALPGREAEFVDCSPMPPIGVHVAPPHVDVERELPPGAAVAGFTDGLIERRNEPLDEGLERLRRVFRAGDVESVCSAVMMELVGSTAVEDDTALVAFRRLA